MPMTHWTDWLFAAFTLATAVFTVYIYVHPRRGWRAWDRGERRNYAVISVAVWPWLIWGFFDEQPLWLNAIAAVLFITAAALFLIDQIRFFRESRAMLAEAEETARRLNGGGRP